MAYLYRLRSNRYRRLPGGAQPTDSYAATGFDQEQDWDTNMPQAPQSEFRNEMFDQLHSENTPNSKNIESANLLENDQLDQT